MVGWRQENGTKGTERERATRLIRLSMLDGKVARLLYTLELNCILWLCGWEGLRLSNGEGDG